MWDAGGAGLSVRLYHPESAPLDTTSFLDAMSTDHVRSGCIEVRLSLAHTSTAICSGVPRQHLQQQHAPAAAPAHAHDSVETPQVWGLLIPQTLTDWGMATAVPP